MNFEQKLGWAGVAALLGYEVGNQGHNEITRDKCLIFGFGYGSRRCLQYSTN
jgi:hypothetical protein